MDSIIKTLLKESWLRTLFIYRIWGNVNIPAIYRIDFPNRENIRKCNCNWYLYKYERDYQSCKIFERFFHTFDSLTLDTIINTFLVSVLYNDQDILNSQACFFEMCSNTLQKILEYAANKVKISSEKEFSKEVSEYLVKSCYDIPDWIPASKNTISIF